MKTVSILMLFVFIHRFSAFCSCVCVNKLCYLLTNIHTYCRSDCKRLCSDSWKYRDNTFGDWTLWVRTIVVRNRTLLSWTVIRVRITQSGPRQISAVNITRPPAHIAISIRHTNWVSGLYAAFLGLHFLWRKGEGKERVGKKEGEQNRT